jgi:hypothetical protein
MVNERMALMILKLRKLSREELEGVGRRAEGDWSGYWNGRVAFICIVMFQVMSKESGRMRDGPTSRLEMADRSSPQLQQKPGMLR